MKYKMNKLRIYTNEQLLEEFNKRKMVYVITQEDIEKAICREISFIELERFQDYYQLYGKYITSYTYIESFIINFFLQEVEESLERSKERHKSKNSIYNV